MTHHGHMRKKLDRGMVNVYWCLLFLHAFMEMLQPYNSYHNPLMVTYFKSPNTQHKLFHFQAAWLSHPDYAKLVTEVWNVTPGNVIYKS